jgi:hypothetical protein
VAGGHVLVEALDGVGAREVAELLVHVVGAGARVIPEPDAKVLDFEGLLLVDLENQIKSHSACLLRAARDATHDVDANDLAIGLFDLFQLPAHTMSIK